MEFKVMTDEHVANAVSEQLIQKNVEAIRLIDVLDSSTPDPEVLEYCHEHGYALITLDRGMDGHAKARVNAGSEHAGIFIAAKVQGTAHIGIIVNFITLYNEAIKESAASVENDVYNKVIYVD